MTDRKLVSICLLREQEPPSTSLLLETFSSVSCHKISIAGLIRPLDGYSEWQKHQRIVEIMSLDPIFDKSQR